MQKEQIIREAAYRLWEAEGKPHDRALEHWRQAEQQIATEDVALPSRRDPHRTDAQAQAPARTKRRTKKHDAQNNPAS